MSTPRTELGLADDPGRPCRTLAEASLLLLAAGRLDAARRAAEGLRRLDPDQPAGHLAAAEVALADGRAEDAATHAEHVALMPGLDRSTAAYATILLGDARCALHDVDGARDAWRSAARLADDAPVAELAGHRLGLEDAASALVDAVRARLAADPAPAPVTRGLR